jgi:hypothetical protein
LIAAAVFSGLALIAGAIAFHAAETRDGAEDPYANAEDIAQAWMNVYGERATVSRVAGPFVMVRPQTRPCFLVDVSTQYEGGGGVDDNFWASGPSSDDTNPQIDC